MIWQDSLLMITRQTNSKINIAPNGYEIACYHEMIAMIIARSEWIINNFTGIYIQVT